MSSAANHRKRSHRSEQYKRSAFNASSRKAFYRTANNPRNRSVLGRLFNAFRRTAPKQTEQPQREVER